MGETAISHSIFSQLTHCPVCNHQKFSSIYSDLEDRVFGIEIKSSLVKCEQCTALFQNPQIQPQYIQLAYETYYTHNEKHDAPKVMQTVSLKSKIKSILKRVDFFYKAVVGYFHTLADAPVFRAAVRYGYLETCAFRYRLFALGPRAAEIGNTAFMFLPADLRGRLLDFGCGNGTFISRMAKYGWICDGLELDPSAVAYARRMNPGAEIMQGGVERLSTIPSESYDAITLYGVIEHVHSPAVLVKEAYRLLKTGGKLVMLTPNVDSIGHKKFKAHWRGLEPPRHLVLFNRKSMQQIFNSSQFTKVDISSSNELLTYIWSMSREIERGRFHFARIPHLRFRIEALLTYYWVWLLDFLFGSNVQKDTLKVVAVK